MFKKRNLKVSNASKRREDTETPNNETITTTFPPERPWKKCKTERRHIRDVDYTQTAKESTFQERNDETAPETEPEMSKSRVVGPKAAPRNIRVTTLTDFQPDVCKDFQQMGYCGYGDTCKFLHIRDELRQKKPIEKEWETVKNNVVSAESKPLEDVPFKCPICKKDYEKPVKTPCDHIFCQSCFMTRFKQEKKRKCFICKKDTGGSVQPIKDLSKAEAT